MESRVENLSGETTNLSSEKIEELKAMLQRAQAKAVESAKVADQAIREHPYPAIGLAFGVGLLVGILVSRR